MVGCVWWVRRRPRTEVVRYGARRRAVVRCRGGGEGWEVTEGRWTSRRVCDKAMALLRTTCSTLGGGNVLARAEPARDRGMRSFIFIIALVVVIVIVVVAVGIRCADVYGDCMLERDMWM